MQDDELAETIDIDITPMATVALILVVIFISSGSMWMQPAMKVDLPQAATAESERKQNVTVSIGPAGELAINDVSVMPENLYDGLLLGLAENRDKFVIVRADKKALYRQITETMSLAKKAGAKSVMIATEQKRESEEVK